MMPSNIDVKTLIDWPMPLIAQVPFTGKECLVIVLFKGFSNSHFLMGEIVAVLRVQHWIGGAITLAGNPVGDIHTYRMAACHYTCASGAAHRAGCITLSEAHSACSEPVDIRSLVKITAIGPNISPAHVINQKEQEIGLLGGLYIKEATKGTKKNNGAKQGTHGREDTLPGRRWQ